MDQLALPVVIVGSLFFVACKGASPDERTSASPAGSSASPARVATAVPAASAPPTANPPAPPTVGEPIPAIDPKLAPERIDLAAYSKKTKDEKAKLVGKKLRLEGSVHSVSYNAMIFDKSSALRGPEKEGTPNGVYAVEIHGKKGPNETWSSETVGCFVDEKTQKELSSELRRNTIVLQVEGIVDGTFNDLAPCKVISKKVAKL